MLKLITQIHEIIKELSLNYSEQKFDEDYEIIPRSKKLIKVEIDQLYLKRKSLQVLVLSDAK
jgi:hypothetical protein